MSGIYKFHKLLQARAKAESHLSCVFKEINKLLLRSMAKITFTSPKDGRYYLLMAPTSTSTRAPEIVPLIVKTQSLAPMTPPTAINIQNEEHDAPFGDYMWDSLSLPSPTPLPTNCPTPAPDSCLANNESFPSNSSLLLKYKSESSKSQRSTKKSLLHNKVQNGMVVVCSFLILLILNINP